MDDHMDTNTEMPHGNVTCDDDVLNSWVSVCPSGLWKVQQKRTRGIRSMVSTSGNNDFIKKKKKSQMYKPIQYFSSSSFLGISSDCPRLGSLCQVRVRLKVEAENLDFEQRNEAISVQCEQPFSEITEATPFSRCQDSVLQVPVGDWTTIRFGEGQCDITEACVEKMRAGETCEVRLMTLN